VRSASRAAGKAAKTCQERAKKAVRKIAHMALFVRLTSGADPVK